MTDPIPVPYGLIMTPMPDGRHIFRPADGIDVLNGGKAQHLAPPPGEGMLSAICTRLDEFLAQDRIRTEVQEDKTDGGCTRLAW